MLYQLQNVISKNIVKVYAVRSMPFKPAAAPDWTANTMILMWDETNKKFLWDDLMLYEPIQPISIMPI